MHVLFVTTEVAGLYKIGGLADVSLSLPIALGKQGTQVTVVLPFYKSISIENVQGVGELSVNYGNTRETVWIFEKKTHHLGVRFLLLRHPKLDQYGGSPIEDTFAFYSQSVVSLHNAAGRFFLKPVDIVHCHDWHTAVIPLLLGEQNKVSPTVNDTQATQLHTVVTIHNLMYQGVVDDSIIERLHAPRALFHIRKDIKKQSVSLLREGFEYADKITTVSPTHAKEIVAHSHHDYIGETLVRRKHEIEGILNGIDPDVWNPETDTTLALTYSNKSVLSAKVKLKKDLQTKVGLPTKKSFLLGFVGRIEPRQKGIDLVMDAVHSLLKDEKIQLVILGTGEKQTVESLKKFASKFPENISFMNEFNDNIAHKIYAGCDAITVPSKFEPCGLVQLIAMRYGTIPIVRRTGGLVDTVSHGVTGFTFEQYSGGALMETISLAMDAYFKTPVKWEKFIRSAMQQDFSWKKSAEIYKRMYDSMLLHP